MILHALCLKNWRSIGSLELDDLGHPLVVLHGPNRIGKSTIAEAIRTVLTEDHSSTSRIVKGNLSWHSKQAPEATIEFEVDAQRYRLQKRYATGREGVALLEKQSPGSSGSWQTLFDGKEAGREVRQILGFEKSWDEGLYHLLWLTQGQVALPAEKDLKTPLKQRFEEVLGSLLTGQDWEFFERLLKEYGKFFTEGGKVTKNSPVIVSEEHCSALENRLTELRRKLDQSEQQLVEFERSEEEARAAAEMLEEARREAQQLSTEQTASRERRRLHEQAQAALAAATREWELAEQRCQEFQTIRTRLSDSHVEFLNAESAFEVNKQQHAELLAAVQAAEQDRQLARKGLDATERCREELDDRRRLLDLTREADALQATLEKTAVLQVQLQQLETELAELQAPKKSQLDKLRKNRQQAQQHAAVLEAQALQVKIHPEQPQSVELTVDDQNPRTETLAPHQPLEQHFRQQFQLSIPQFGRIEIRRGQQNLSLEETARKLETLGREFTDQVRSFGLDPEHPDVLEVLEEHRSRSASLTADSQRLTEELAKLAPDGTAGIQSTLQQFNAERQAIVARATTLADWVPSLSEFEALQAESTQELKRAKRSHADAEKRGTDAQAAARAAETRLQDLRNELTARRVQHGNCEAELRRLGDEFSLQAARDTLAAKQQQARQQVDETTLSAEEQTIDQRLEAARNACDLREDRHRSHLRQCDQLRGELRSLQGLHEELAAAEAEVLAARAIHNRIQREADACRLLRETFESCRDAQVRRTTGSINERVMNWARQLGLQDYQELSFDRNYLPVGLQPTDSDVTVALADESYGTTEQLAMLVRLAVGGLLAKGERQLAMLDDPLTHADRLKHRKMLEILQSAATGGGSDGGEPAVSPLQILIFTCHPERFDHLPSARCVDLAQQIRRAPAAS